MTDQPPDSKYLKPQEGTSEVKPDPESPEVSLKFYYVPNRHDRRKAAAIKRREERKKINEKPA